ncbi:DinB family protein [Pedobacter sp. AW31-3R]|uniref:DinB family protein n=1 Tax=Pedobacter sp. AW31-3R TaxID=3445781 RepID=UPI003F9F3FD6
MKVNQFMTALCLTFGMINFAQAQTSAADMVKDWERAKAYTKEYLDAMPESGYAMKPTANTRTFAAQMLHLADTNYGFTASATGAKSPLDMGALEKSTDQSKATVIKNVLASYDYVIAGIKSLTPAQLNEKIKLFGKFELTREIVFAKDFEHQTHQRAQTAPYLHLAGIKPPAEKLF